MSHDTSNCWGGMSFSVITMEMCSFPIRHTYICSHRDTRSNTAGLNRSVWVFASPRGSHGGSRGVTHVPLPICFRRMPQSAEYVWLGVEGGNDSPLVFGQPEPSWWPGGTQLRPPPLNPLAAAEVSNTCASIPQTDYWCLGYTCIQMCKINRRIRYQTTQTFTEQRFFFSSFCNSASSCLFST